MYNQNVLPTVSSVQLIFIKCALSNLSPKTCGSPYSYSIPQLIMNNDH